MPEVSQRPDLYRPPDFAERQPWDAKTQDVHQNSAASPPDYMEETANETMFMLGIEPDDSEAFKLFKVMMVDIWSVLVSLLA